MVFILLGRTALPFVPKGLLSAWFTSFIVALIALMSLSLPCRIIIIDKWSRSLSAGHHRNPPRDEITSVRRGRPADAAVHYRSGGCGFFGYYGHFIDLRRLERVRLYASGVAQFRRDRRHLRDRLHVSCAEADHRLFSAELTPPGGNRPEDDEEPK